MNLTWPSVPQQMKTKTSKLKDRVIHFQNHQEPRLSLFQDWNQHSWSKWSGGVRRPRQTSPFLSVKQVPAISQLLFESTGSFGFFSTPRCGRCFHQNMCVSGHGAVGSFKGQIVRGRGIQDSFPKLHNALIDGYLKRRI